MLPTVQKPNQIGRLRKAPPTGRRNIRGREKLERTIQKGMAPLMTSTEFAALTRLNWKRVEGDPERWIGKINTRVGMRKAVVSANADVVDVDVASPPKCSIELSQPVWMHLGVEREGWRNFTFPRKPMTILGAIQDVEQLIEATVMAAELEAVLANQLRHDQTEHV